MRRAAGFTLLEVLIAVAIFAVVGVMAYGGLQAVITQQAIARDNADRFRELQFAVQQISRDLLQLNPRPVREPLGDGYRAALYSDPRSEILLEFTRGGWTNPLGQPRAAVQRVAYVLEDGLLLRRHWFVPDQTLGEEAVEREVLDGVLEVRLRFFAPGGWSEQWPAGGTATDPSLRPLAVEVTLELEDWGEIRRLLEVPN
jgi:general secretion pathway protein J